MSDFINYKIQAEIREKYNINQIGNIDDEPFNYQSQG